MGGICSKEEACSAFPFMQINVNSRKTAGLNIMLKVTINVNICADCVNVNDTKDGIYHCYHFIRQKFDCSTPIY